MIIRKYGYTLDVDVEDTLKYSKEHGLCDCDEDRNLYAQIADKFPKLKEFLAELGLLIERPDETTSYAVEDYIDYHFVSYTVIGKILESDKYEIDIFDGGLFLNIVIDNWYVPNDQKTDKYFTVTIYGIDLPWVLDEPFPETSVTRNKMSFFAKIKSFFVEISAPNRFSYLHLRTVILLFRRKGIRTHSPSRVGSQSILFYISY